MFHPQATQRILAPRRLSVAYACLAAATLAIAGCGDSSESSQTPATSTTSTHAHDTDLSASRQPDEYTVRGEVTALPADGELMRIHHEAIPEFKSMSGETVGMVAMTMPFPLGDDVELGDLAVGDKVSFTFVVTWSGDRPWHVTRIETLDPATELDFASPTPTPAPTPSPSPE